MNPFRSIRIVLPVLIACSLAAAPVHGATWYVPGDYSSIEDALLASKSGDTIIVRPGTYFENLRFHGKAVTVKSELGPAVTVIDGSRSGSVVHFDYPESLDTVLDGFTITNGDSFCGGGIACLQCCPTIRNNIISNNTARHDGGGIYCAEASPLIANNIVAGNSAEFGGGLLFSVNDSFPILAGNTIYGNSASAGGGLMCEPRSNPIVSNSIFFGNQASEGKEIFLSGMYSDGSSLAIRNSDVEGGQGSVHVDPGCRLLWGAGMIDADPLFVDPAGQDLHLTFDSPCKNGGTFAGPGFLSVDMEGDPRTTEHWPDMGSDEFHSHLYEVGSAVPGANVLVRFAGDPGASVVLAAGSGIKDPPLPTPYGPFYLERPLKRFTCGTIPAEGILTVNVKVPSSWSAGERHPFQAMLWSSSPALTNPMVVPVR